MNMYVLMYRSGNWCADAVEDVLYVSSSESTLRRLAEGLNELSYSLFLHYRDVSNYVLDADKYMETCFKEYGFNVKFDTSIYFYVTSAPVL